MLTIHIGVMPDELKTLENQLDRFSVTNEMPPFAPFTEYDSWEEWGEASPDKSQAIHVQVTTLTPQRDMHILANLFQMFLVPMHKAKPADELGEMEESDYERSWDGLRMALTDATDYSQEYEEFRW